MFALFAHVSLAKCLLCDFVSEKFTKLAKLGYLALHADNVQRAAKHKSIVFNLTK